MAHEHEFDRSKIEELAEEYGGVDELAKHLNITAQQVKNWIGATQLPSIPSLLIMANGCRLKPGYFFREVKR